MLTKMRGNGDVTVDRRAAGGAGGSVREPAAFPAWTARTTMRRASARSTHAAAVVDTRHLVVGIATGCGSGTGAVVGLPAAAWSSVCAWDAVSVSV